MNKEQLKKKLLSQAKRNKTFLKINSKLSDDLLEMLEEKGYNVKQVSTETVIRWGEPHRKNILPEDDFPTKDELHRMMPKIFKKKADDKIKRIDMALKKAKQQDKDVLRSNIKVGMNDMSKSAYELGQYIIDHYSYCLIKSDYDEDSSVTLELTIDVTKWIH